MKCSQCDETDTKVIESRDVLGNEAIRRRRMCLKCSYRYTTYERVERPQLMVVKNDGTRQLFSRAKLLTGLQHASEKTSVSGDQLERLVNHVERELYASGEAEIPSGRIGELVMARLADLNDVAYVRFASVYRRFKTIAGFEKELKTIKSRKPKASAKVP